MWVIVGIVVIVIAFNVVRALIETKNLPNMDEAGNMRCKGCGCSSFNHWENRDGTTTYECNMCGKRWTRA